MSIDQISIQIPRQMKFEIDRITGLRENPFFERIREIIYRENRNCLIAITGRAGTGKSYVALRIAYSLDPTFNENTLSERIVRNEEEFLRLLVEKDKLRKGSAVIFDEAGVSLANREWQSLNNRIIDRILQTFRYRNLLTIFTVPYMTFMDIHAQKQLHYKIMTKTVRRSHRLNTVNIYELFVDQFSDELRIKKPIFISEKKMVEIKTFRFLRVPFRLAQRYEKFASEMKGNIPEKELRLLEMRKQTGSQIDLTPYIDAATKERDMLKGRHHGHWTIPVYTIKSRFNVSESHARDIRKAVLLALKEKEPNEWYA